MKKLQFALPEYKQLEVNGHVFNILKADSEILEKAQTLRTKYSGLSSADVEVEEIVGAVREVISYVDEILGEGATKTIIENRPLGIVDGIKLLSIICQAVVEEYNESLLQKYGDE